ncbi:aminopeptidase N-like [Ptychodera flava]|uniref:aminopeptidase N-like n=1 Tax=Ptychodera flava TaxID=63121 RepID=UPI00396AA7DA
MNSYKQIEAINTACYYGHQHCVDSAQSQFNQWLDNPEETSCLNYASGTVLEMSHDSHDLYPQKFLSEILYLDYALTKKEANSVIGSVLRNSPIGYSMAVEFTMANWDALRAAHGTSAFNIVWQFADFMNTAADLMKLEEFGRKSQYVPGFPEKTYQSTVDKVKLNIQWMERNYEAVYQQLMDATSKTEEPADEREPFDGRLPETLAPSLYTISVTPYLDEEDGEKRFTFDGSVEIIFEVLNSTDVIVLHAHGTLKVDDSDSMITVAEKDNPSQTIGVDRVEIVEKYEFVMVHLTSNLVMGSEYIIKMDSFTGTLHHADFQGLYLSNYTEGGETKHMVATQLETTNARRVFPCFDEPALKATFDVTIVHKNTRIALCNMPVKETTTDGDWNTTVFDTTSVVMPTYLIAIVVADFRSMEIQTANNKTMRVWSRPEALSALNYSMHTGSEMLTFFEDYWEIGYPLPKQDMVAIPDFYFGAMENWGLVLYRETALLYDPQVNDQYRKHRVAAIIAHELAHMWFGNLVTLDWWDHVWLNEGYASFFELPVLEAVEPSWDVFNQFFQRDDLYRAMDFDDSWSSHPTVRPVGWPDDIWSQFDRIAYQRGSCMNMMMRTFLGEDTFKEGLKSYLNEYQYSNAVSDQLFAELTKADVGKKNTDVKKVMDTWLLQMGYPVVTLSRDGNTIHAEQTRFIMDPNEEPNDKHYDMGYKWHIPLTFTDESEKEYSNPTEAWMEVGPADFNIPTSSGDDWYLVNINQNGFYRVKYEDANWNKLATYLKENDHTTIPVRTRAQLLDDAFSIANAHQMDQVYSIKLLEYLSKETDYLPLYTAILRHGYTRDMLKRTAAYGYLERHMRYLLNNSYWELEWDFSHDSHLGYYKQIDSLRTACYYGHSDCIMRAKMQFNQWMDNINDTSAIESNLKDTVYCAAMKYGSEDIWERAWSLYDSENIPSDERSRVRSALACSKEQWILERYMEYALLKKEASSVIGNVLRNSGHTVAWDFTMNNWNELKEIHGNGALSIVWQFADYMNTDSDLTKLQAFGNKYMDMPGFSTSSYQNAVDKVKLNIDWMKRNYQPVYQQLKDATRNYVL